MYIVGIPPGEAIGRKGKASSAPLSEEVIVAAAQELTRRVGIERLTMRALADALGVSPMATYHHVESRDSLLLLMVEQVMSAVEPPNPDSTDPWDAQLWQYMQAMGTELGQYPGMSDFLQHHELTEAARRYMEECIAILRRGGFSAEDARTAFIVIYTYMWGGSIFQGIQSRRRASGGRRDPRHRVPTVEELASDQAVEVGYRTIVAGLRVTMDVA